MRHSVGSSEPDVMIASDKDQKKKVQEERRRPHGIPVRTVRSAKAPSSRASPFRLQYRMRCYCHPETMERLAFRVCCPRPTSPTQDFLLTFAARGLTASPCSVTTTASDDEFSMPTITPRCNLGSHFPPLAGLAGMGKIFSLRIPGSSVCCPFAHAASAAVSSHRYRCHTCSSSSILASGRAVVPTRCFRAAFSVLAWPATSSTARSLIPLDLLSPTDGSLWDGLASLLASWCDFLANASIAGSPARCRT